jgi:hypothetical protein
MNIFHPFLRCKDALVLIEDRKILPMLGLSAPQWATPSDSINNPFPVVRNQSSCKACVVESQMKPSHPNTLKPYLHL